MEEISWRKKSRISWIKEGDTNTIFFCRMASMMSRANYLGWIEFMVKSLRVLLRSKMRLLASLKIFTGVRMLLDPRLMVFPFF